MAITTSTLAASYFVLDVPDVRWTGASAGRRVRVVVNPENGTRVEFSENYTPDNDNAVTLRGLAELIEPYVKPCPTPLRQDLVVRYGVWLATVTRASFTVQLYDDNGSTIQPTFHSYAYYASQRTDATPGTTIMWLTRYHERTIISVQPITLSVFLIEGVTARFVCEGTDDNGNISNATVNADLSSGQGASAGSAPAYAAVVHYTVAELEWAAHVGTLRRVNAELLYNGSVVDSVTFRIDHSHHASRYVVAFTNCFGMIETEAFTGADEATTEMDAEFSWMDRDYEKTSTREITQHRMAARYTDDVRRNSLRDIMTSLEVYVIHCEGQDCWERHTVTGFEMTDKRPHTAPQTAYITLRPSAMHQEVVTRQGEDDPGQTRHRIFDNTFDYTFN